MIVFKNDVHGDQLNMAVFFWYLKKSDLSSRVSNLTSYSGTGGGKIP